MKIALIISLFVLIIAIIGKSFVLSIIMVFVILGIFAIKGIAEIFDDFDRRFPRQK